MEPSTSSGIWAATFDCTDGPSLESEVANKFGKARHGHGDLAGAHGEAQQGEGDHGATSSMSLRTPMITRSVGVPFTAPNVHNGPNRSAAFSGGFLMGLRLSFLPVALLAAAPGCAAAFEAYVAADIPLQVSPNVDARPVTTMGANIPFNVLGCGRWCQVQYGGTAGYVPANFVIPGAPPTAPGSGLLGFLAAPVTLNVAAPGLLSDGYAPRADYGYGWTPILGTSPEPECEGPAKRGRCGKRKTVHREMRDRPPM